MRILIAAVAVAIAGAVQAAFTMSGAGANGMRRASDVQVQSFKLHFAPRAAVAPKLDGKLDDACWQGNAPICDYGPCTIQQNPMNRIPKTEVRLAWDDKYLYVAAQCWEDSPENMESFLKIVNDGKCRFFARDCIEMHIDGNNDEHTTFQCWLLANHEKYIHWNYDFGWGILTDNDYGLNADWDIAHTIGKDSWTVEARYALSHFELKPKAGYIFGFEPARFRYTKTIFNKATGEASAKRGGQWLAWGAQGKNHHYPNGYGKVVFVEKTPISVVDGLKLAYPDLKERVIYVQTGSEYAVFDQGKESTLTYAAKAEQLIGDTRKLAERYRKFAGEVSNVVWKTSAGAMKQTAKTFAEFEAFAQKRQGAAAPTIAEIGEMETKCGAWSGKFETAYWELVRDAMLVEKRTRVPVKLNPAPNAPELGSEFADATFKPEERTHDIVEWAKPLALGKKKVFITVNSEGGIDAWQLAKRLEMDATIFQSTGEDREVGVKGDYYNEGLWFTAKKRQELERALKEKGPFDAFVFIGTRVQTWPAELQCWLLEQTLKGAKVIEQNGGGRSFIANMSGDGELVAGSPKGMTKLAAKAGNVFEMESIPVNLGKEPLKSSVFGKGVYGRLATDVTSGWHHSPRATPSWVTKPENLFQDEYGFAYFVRNVMQILGCREGRRAVDVGDGLCEIEANDAATVPFRTAGAAEWKGEIGWKVRDQQGKVLEENVAAYTIPAGTNHVSLALKPLPAGEYYVDATLYGSGKKVIDFASGRVVVANRGKFVKCGCSPNCKELLASPTIAEFKLASKTLSKKDEPVKATVKVTPAAAGLTLRAEIRDVRNRVIVRKDYPVDAVNGTARIELANVPEYDWTLANLDVTLLCGTRKLDAKSEEFFRHRGDVDDYMVFTSNPSPGGWFGKQRLVYDMNSGIDLYQKDYSANYLRFGGDAVLRDRIPGGAPDKGGSLTNPWWLRHVKQRYAKHAAALKSVNGRFVSLGDDSGEPNDFPRNCPDWIPCWVAKQMENCRRDAERFARDGHKRAVFAATTKWWRDHGSTRSGADNLTSYWGFEAPLKNYATEWLKLMKTPQDLKEVVDSCKEVYGSVEKFNRAANVKVRDWKEITPELLVGAKWDPSPEYVNFLFWLQARYKDIAKLNAAWKTDVKEFTEIPRALIDEKLAEGVYTPSFDMQTFLEDAFVGQARAIAEGIHGQDPSIGLGFGASTLGNTFTESVKWLDSVCPYAGSFDIELMRGQKHKFIGECIGVYGGRNVPEPMRKKQVWHGLLTGCNFGWFWDACYFHGDNSIDARQYGTMFETYREVKRGPAQLLLRSKRDNYGVKLMVSRDAGHFAAFLKDMSTHAQSLRGFGGLLESLGLQYDSVTGEQVARGEILRDGTKVLVLPYLQAIRAKEAETIREFVKRGGTVLADARVGLFDEKGVAYAKPALDDVFGVVTGPKALPKPCDVYVQSNNQTILPGALVDASVKATTAKALGSAANGAVAFLVNDFGKGHAILLNFNLAVIPFLQSRGELGGVRGTLEGLVALAGLKPMAVMKNEKGELVSGTEFVRYVRDRHVYLAVEKSGLVCETFPMKAYVQLDDKYWVYDVRAGKKVGFTDRIPMTLGGLDIGLFSLLPAEAKSITLDVPSTVRPGESLVAIATLDQAAKVSKMKHACTCLFRWELIPEGGDSREEFRAYPWRVKDARAGGGTTEWAIGYDEKPGTKYTVIVTDVATGLAASRTVTVSDTADGMAKVNFFAKDLVNLDVSKVKAYKPGVIEWIRDGKATMPIVSRAGKKRYGRKGWELPPLPEAERLASIVFEMTGVKPEIVIEKPGTVATNSPAVYIGSSACERFGKFFSDTQLDPPCVESEAFRVVSEKGSVYFAGFTSHAVADFAERALGLRCYWEKKMGGWYYVKTPTLMLPEIDYSDAPVYPRRTMWPFAHYDWYPMWKVGNSWPIHCNCHQPYTWWRETNFNYKVTRPEIFQLGRDGNRQPPMLCYGNPKTLETYKERLELELAGGPKAGMYNAAAKTITVSQWDGLIDCQCEYCKNRYDPSRGTTGNASPIIWGFAAKLADWMHEKHPDITVTILPYLNTCDLPKGVAFPHKNVEAEVCSMPGLALFKNKDVAEHEEKLIKDWAKLTGRPVRSWNYLCWPAEFCNAPYLFGHAAVDHYKRMRGYIVGAFMNGTGTPPERRVMMAAYVWMRAMWNPELDVEAVYDGMCERMFGAAAKPMRKFMAMQEGGWNRQWGAGQVSNKNIYEVSYPRKEVIEMENLLAEARKLTAADSLIQKRLDRYTEGFQAFFDESKNLAEGTALEPTLIKKVGSDPIVDGKLDDDAWKLATAYPFVHARNKEKPQPTYPTTVKMVWTPNGVTFGFDCIEPYSGDAAQYASVRKRNPAEEIEIFLDPSGTGDGHFYQIFTDDRGEPLFYTDGPKWMPKGVKAATHFDKGRWGMEVFVPFADLKDFPKAQMPSGTSAEGKFWIGNVMRNRMWDGWWKKTDRKLPDSVQEFSRRYTRYSVWSKDPAAFGKLQFVE